MSRRRCLPVLPSVERMEVIVLTYTTGEGTEREPAHPHKVVYTLDGQLVANECSYWPHQNEDTLP